MTESKSKFKQVLTTMNNDSTQMKSRLREMEEKINATHKFMISNFSYLGDIETRIECLKKVMFDNNLVTPEAFDEMWDGVKGIRVKGEDELIVPGDFCRVTFRGVDKVTDEVLLEEENFPIRLGAKTLFIEEYLLGQKVGKRSFEFDHTYEDDYQSNLGLAGKTLAFRLHIDKVKTRINNGNMANA